MKKIIVISITLILSIIWCFAEIDEVPGTIFGLVKDENAKEIQVGDHNGDNKEDVYYIDDNGNIKVFVQANATVGGASNYDLTNSLKQAELTVASSDDFADVTNLNDNLSGTSARNVNGFTEGKVVFTLMTSKPLGKFVINPDFNTHDPTFGYSLLEVKIEGSNDGSNWFQLNELIRISNGTFQNNVEFPFRVDYGNNSCTIELNNSTSYIMYRFHMNSNTLTSLKVREIEGYAVLP